MFSGIIDKLGKVASATRSAGALTCVIDTGYDDLSLGESVAVNGVCLTVARLVAPTQAEFFASAETLSRTNLAELKSGGLVNLERAVSLQTRLSGHLVQGHVDGLAKLHSVVPADGATLLQVDVPKHLGRHCVEKGSITLDGISLTINALDDLADATRINLTIIPHTWTHTNLHTRAAGDALNVETDVIAKHMERLCQPYLKS